MPVGFVLQPTYRMEAGVPVVHIHGKLRSGGGFLIRDTRQVPGFHVRQADAARARAVGAVIDDAARPAVTLRGEPAVRVALRAPSDAAALRDRLSAAGIRSFEADVRYAYRYLFERGIRGSLSIDGKHRDDPALGTVFDDPEVAPADWTPALSILSIDIETDPRAQRLLSIALVGCGASEVLLLTPQGYGCPAGAAGFATEKELLAAFARRVRELDPDILTGWNFIDFDMAVLLRIAGRLGLHLALGRGPGAVRLRPPSFPRGQTTCTVPGRVVLDGIQLLRGAFVKVERYGLNAVSRQILGRGKTITGGDRAGEILEAFESDREHLVAYNRNDAQLVLDILDRLKLLDLTVERSRLTGMPPDRVSASIASFDFLYLSELHRRGIVAPSVGRSGGEGLVASGGHVLDSAPGLYRNVLVLDFKSLYPSIIRTFQVDPLGYLPRPGLDDDPIVAPNGAAFRREPGILPRMLDELFPRRAAARAAGNAVASQAIKILMNSFYGVLGTSACRFADPALVNAITGFGREILLWSRDRIEERGYRVLYGDTDSLFVLSGVGSADEARGVGRQLVADLNQELSRHVDRKWRVRSKLELEFEKLYTRLMLPVVRHGTAGARKRYVGLVEEDGASEVVFTGMEVVRSDWTPLARRVQRELYERLLSDRPVDAYLKEEVAALRDGRRDAELVYRKALRKPLADYTASTPPHVAAARRMAGRPGRVVSYVITEHGAEPAGEVRGRIDHEHYVQKQVRPIAEPVLTLVGLDFDRVIGDDTQLRLF